MTTLASDVSNLARRVVRHLPPQWQSGIATWRARRFVSRTDIDAYRVLPVHALKAVQRKALEALRGSEPLGDYLEFGVFAGTSMTCMSEVLEERGLRDVRLFGFDSFEGMPPQAASEDEGTWAPGQFKFELEVTRAIMERRGVDLSRVTLTKGWFSDTLTPAFRTRHALQKASVIMVDCDLYSSTVDVLRFVEPLIQDRVVMFFDDWNSNELAAKNMGERRAFDEFLSAHPELEVEDFGSYASHAQCFLVTRARDVTRLR
ncbi:MAG: TylF/MycF/NovP-related O-methyltransferase [Polyangiales bacterium]